MNPRCWFAQLPDAGPCAGVPVRCHLIPKAKIKQWFPKGAVRIDGRWQPTVEAAFIPESPRERRTLRELQDDPRAWVPGCGGPTGIGGHHGLVDQTAIRPLSIARAQLPPEVEDYAAELGVTWWLERTYL